MKSKLKVRAIKLRKRGLSYSEILQEVPVAKSTLSLWLRSVGLSKKQKQRITEKKLAAALRGSQARRIQRLVETEKIKKKAIREAQKIGIDSKKLWLLGIMLYWAEGDKEKSHMPSVGVGFINSDPNMIKIFLKWIEECLGIAKDQISFRIYLHENNIHRLNQIKKYWAENTGFPLGRFDKITLKRHKISSSRKNKGNSYYGLLKIQVLKSTKLNRRIAGWIEGICIQCGVV